MSTASVDAVAAWVTELLAGKNVRAREICSSAVTQRVRLDGRPVRLGMVRAVREVMSESLVTVEPTTSVAGAVTVMGIHRVGAVLVMEAERLEGIFTERDLVRAMSYDIGAAGQPVSDWMTKDPVTVSPDESVERALEIMLARNFRHLPVMKDNRLIGVVSIRDLSRASLVE